MVTDANINNEFLVETVKGYLYESKNESYNINVEPIKLTQPPVNDCDCKITEEEWRIAQSIILHIPTVKCVAFKTIKTYMGDLYLMIVLIACTIQ